MKKRRHAWEEDGGKPRLTAIRVGIQDVGGGMIAARAQEEDPSIAVLAASIAKHGLLQPVVAGGRADGPVYPGLRSTQGAGLPDAGHETD